MGLLSAAGAFPGHKREIYKGVSLDPQLRQLKESVSPLRVRDLKGASFLAPFLYGEIMATLLWKPPVTHTYTK